MPEADPKPSPHLCITVEFLTGRYHGRDERGRVSWPPSPLRLYQALASSAAGASPTRSVDPETGAALRWLAAQPPPAIEAPADPPVTRARTSYVPDNIDDAVGRAWSRGKDATLPKKRSEKRVQAIDLDGAPRVRFMWAADAEAHRHLPRLRDAARGLTHLGAGVDAVAGDAAVEPADTLHPLHTPGHPRGTGFWRPADSGATSLRLPAADTLDELVARHGQFLNRLHQDVFRPVDPLLSPMHQPYLHDLAAPERPFRGFELRRLDGTSARFDPRKLMHVAGMTRHLALQNTRNDPPAGAPEDWAGHFVRGAPPAPEAADAHPPFDHLSYLPLPTLGHRHADPGIRRVLLSAPAGADDWLSHVAQRIAGHQLESDADAAARYKPEDLPLLVPLDPRADPVVRRYTRPAAAWASVTPVVLPGRIDGSGRKAERLVMKSLARQGIHAACDIEISTVSAFPKLPPARGRGRSPFLPKHLQRFHCAHVVLRFHASEAPRLRGPLALGAGRHHGFGLMAGIEDR